MPRGKTHMGRYVPFVDFIMHILSCDVFLSLSHVQHPFDVTRGQAGVDGAQMFLVEHSNISLRQLIATNLARIHGFNFNFYKNYQV